LSGLPLVLVATGFDQLTPPLVERLVTTWVVPLERMPSEEISQMLCLASKATAGSLIALKAPGGLATVVVPGRNPLFQVLPLSDERAQPMLAEPPPKTRPTWKTETMVLPATKVSGSTSVRC
jgi:hypothetical protein